MKNPAFFSLLVIAISHPAVVIAQACPSPNIKDVVEDPVVKNSMDKAWADSNGGTAFEHEEGSNIYQCRQANGNGGYDYSTEIDIGVGDIDSLQLPPRRTDANCRLVGDFHTHPGTSISNPGSDDSYSNDEPSAQDRMSGIPGIIRYGLGDDVIDITYNGLINPNLSWECEPVKTRPVSWGDPHLRTFDGVKYSFHAVGEFNLLTAIGTDSELHVQVRHEPLGNQKNFSITTAAAFNVAGNVVSFYYSSSPQSAIIDGVESAVAALTPLSNGGFLSAIDEDTVRLSWPDGSVFDIRWTLRSLDLKASLDSRYRNSIAGLLGNNNGDPSDDIVTADNQIVPLPLDAATMYGEFAEGWRITQQESLFVYSSGQGTSDFTDRMFPAEIITLDSLDSNDKAVAESACLQVGIDASHQAILNACIFDHVCLGPDGLDSYRGLLPSLAGLEVVEELEIIGVRDGTIPFDTSGPTTAGDTPLIIASANGDVGEIELLINSGEDPDVARESDGWTPLIFASQGGHASAVILLLDAGANVDRGSENGWTPLMIASQNGHHEVVSVLLSRGADVRLSRVDRWTALHSAITNSRPSVSQLLLNAGAPTEASFRGFTPLTYTAQDGAPDLAAMLIQAGANLLGDSDGGPTPMYMAAQNNHVDVMNVLLTEDVDPNNGGTEKAPLLQASAKENVGAVQVLISAAADLNIVDSRTSYTPLMWAAVRGNFEIANLLFTAGADVSIADRNGRTAGAIAWDFGFMDIATLLGT